MSDFVEVKTAELVGPALDWLVGKITNRQTDWSHSDNCLVYQAYIPWAPSTYWAQGGPLIAQYQIELLPSYGSGILKHWYAFFQPNSRKYMKGDTALIAVCRAVVAANLGDVVQVPANLVGVDGEKK